MNVSMPHSLHILSSLFRGKCKRGISCGIESNKYTVLYKKDLKHHSASKQYYMSVFILRSAQGTGKKVDC